MTQSAATPQGYITVNSLADRYSVGPATIWRWARDPKSSFPTPVKLGANCTRWRLADIEKWEAEREVA